MTVSDSVPKELVWTMIHQFGGLIRNYGVPMEEFQNGSRPTVCARSNIDGQRWPVCAVRGVPQGIGQLRTPSIPSGGPTEKVLLDRYQQFWCGGKPQDQAQKSLYAEL